MSQWTVRCLRFNVALRNDPSLPLKTDVTTTHFFPRACERMMAPNSALLTDAKLPPI